MRISTHSTFILALALFGCASPPTDDAASNPDVDVANVTGSPDSPAAPAAPTPGAPPAPAQPAAARGHHRCGWVYTNEPTGADSFTRNAAWFDAIHPVWFALQPDGRSLRPLADVDDPFVLQAARKAGVAVIPLVASVENPAWTRSMLRDPAVRAAHVAALVKLAVDRHYDGLDLDYEKLWDAADGPGLAAFAQAFGAAMKAAGKQSSMAVPALDGASTVWNYSTLAGALDHVHIMGYDFHHTGGHSGPTAPLGWIDAVGAWVQRAGNPAKFIMALPNYGITTGGAYDLGGCAARCSSPAVVDGAEMATCALNPHRYAAGRALHCPSSGGTLYFDDIASLEEKARSAKAHGLGGLSFWKVGGEPPGFFEALRKYY